MIGILTAFVIAISLAIVLPSCAAEPTRAAGSSEQSGSAPKSAAVSPETIAVSFATNRNRIEGNSAAEFYGSERGRQLRFGSCHVQFSPIPGLDKVSEAMPFYVPSEFKKVVDTRMVDESRIWNQIMAADAGKGKVVVYIHGYNISFEKACRRAAMFQRAIGFNENLVLFTWPADGNFFNYTRDEADLRWSIRYIQDFLERLVERAGTGNVHLVGHSLGARGLVEALASMNWATQATPPFDQLVLLAPDVDAEIFRGELPKLISQTNRITLYASENDNALKMSRRIHGYPRLGEGGADLTLLEGMETLDVSAAGAYEVSGHLYHHFNPLVVADIRRVLSTGDSASQRPGLRAHRRSGLKYWKIGSPKSGGKEAEVSRSI